MVKRCFYDKENGELEEKTYRKPYKCDGCLMKGIGKGCRCKECDYVLHKDCMRPRDKLKSPLFQESDGFKFYEKPPPGPPCKKRKCLEDHSVRYCDACGKLVEGFVYHCEKTDADLHPCCAKLELEFTIQKYAMEFMLKKDRSMRKCDWCKSKVVRGGDKDIRGWFYESVDKKFNCHVFCIMDITIQSCEIAKKNADGDFKSALEEQLKSIKKRGRNGKKMSLEVLEIVVSKVLSMVLGDPTGIVGQLLVKGGMALVDYLMQLLTN